jgi:glutathione S-transferase
VEYIIYKRGDGCLALSPSHPDYADYIYWFHFSNQYAGDNWAEHDDQGCTATHRPPVVGDMDARPRNVLTLLDSRLEHATWLAGDEFVAIDIMRAFSLTTVRMFMPSDLYGYPQILRYLGREGV